MIKVVLNLSNDQNILNAITSYFKGISNFNNEALIDDDIDSLISKTGNLETFFTRDFSKCVCDDKNGWTIAVCNLNETSAELVKIKILISRLKRICGKKVYLLTVFENRYVAANLAWENEDELIDIQVVPKNNNWDKLFKNVCDLIAKIDMRENLKGRNVILYGYKSYAASSYVKINNVCDTTYHNSIEIDGVDIPIISQEKMLSTKNAFVIIGLTDPRHREEAASLLKSKGFQFGYLEDYIVKDFMISLDHFISNSIVCYRDIWGNKFVYASDKAYKVIINIQIIVKAKRVSGNKVFIGRNFNCHIPQSTYLRLRGANNCIYIDNNVEINNLEIIVSQGQTVRIGENSLFGRNCIFRSEISHPLFLITTKKIIPSKKDIIIGKHVWLGEECYLLNGARIGDGAILGARSLSSGYIDSNSLAVGAPAKIVKTGVIWAKDNDIEKIETIDDCIDQEGLKFIK